MLSNEPKNGHLIKYRLKGKFQGILFLNKSTSKVKAECFCYTLEETKQYIFLTFLLGYDWLWSNHYYFLKIVLIFLCTNPLNLCHRWLSFLAFNKLHFLLLIFFIVQIVIIFQKLFVNFLVQPTEVFGDHFDVHSWA